MTVHVPRRKGNAFDTPGSPCPVRPGAGQGHSPVVEYQRFSVADVNAGRTAGWTFASGWFALTPVHGAWAWFKREAGADAP